MIEELASAPTNPEDLFAFPLSFAQRRLWFLHSLEGGSAYNMPLPRRFRGTLDVDALERSWNELVARHEILRTTFGADGGEPYQLVHPPQRERLQSVDISAHTDPDHEMERIVLEQALQPFDLEAGPPWRLLLLCLAADDHVLVLTLHHIACDGWSVSILFRELAALYTEFTGGPPAQLRTLPIQYADFAVNQREWMQGDVLQDQLAYWRSKLEGAPTALDLPTDRPRPAVLSTAGGHVLTTMPTELLERLKLLSRQEGVTLFMTLLAAFDLLLACYSRQSELLVGTPVANRHRVELEELVGFLTNTLVLRLDASPEVSFRQLLRSVRETVLEAEAHQDLPFELLVEELNPPRDRSRAPLFQTLFSFYNTPDAAVVELPGLTIEGVPLERATAKFDLSLFMRETSDGLRATFEFSEDLFDRATVARMGRHLQTLLEAVVENPDQSRGDIDVIDDEERHQLLVEWNATEAPSPSGRVDELISEQAAIAPDRIAVEAGEKSLTYGKLEQRSNQLAHHLQQLGIGTDHLVGICVARTTDLLVAVLGILKAGAGYVPLDPTYPPDRLAFMLRDSNASMIVTEMELLSLLPETGAPVVCIDRDWSQIASSPVGPIVSSARPDSVAVVIYTSGSTGRPKGVQTPHGALVNLLSSVQRDLQFGRDDVFLATTTLSFDIAAAEIYVPLLSGGRVAVAPTGAAANPTILAELLNRHRVTFMQATPSGWRLLLDGGWAGRPGMTALTAGEPLTVELADALLSRVDGLWNYYGPTETTIYSTGTQVRPRESVTIGRPVANTQVYVLDERLRPTPIGVPGELHIGGHGLARGYLDRPELTAERFIAHPFEAAPGERVYRTGDLARYRADGEIEYLGRLDHQVKIRGYRIELGEIESALISHEHIREAVVVAREDIPGDPRLVAYIVATTPAGPTPTELKTFLRATLPEFMVPSAFVPLEELPLGPSRKVDRGALPAPDRGETTDEELVLPRDEIEITLSGIWQDLLGIETDIGVHDDFFELGGHSLLAVRLMALVEECLGARLPLTTLFDSATIEGLANRVVEARSNDAQWQTVVPLRPAGSKPPLFFLHGHDGELLYFRELVWRLDPDQPAFGVQPVGLDGRSQPFRSVQEMAAHYTDEILALRPLGPHLLVGYCFSGVLAYEVALQLQNRGQPPALVALIDAQPRGRRPNRAELERRKLTAFMEADTRGKLRWITRRSRGLAAKAKERGRRSLYELIARSGRRPPEALTDLQAVLRRAVSDYVTPSSRLHVTVFRAAEDDGHDQDRYSGWNTITSNVEVHPIVAEGIRHDNIVREPYAAILAEELAKCVRQALAEPKQSALPAKDPN